MSDHKVTKKSFEELSKVKEKDIKHKDYTSREEYRNSIYGGTPPEGYRSWGDYWKSR